MTKPVNPVVGKSGKVGISKTEKKKGSVKKAGEHTKLKLKKQKNPVDLAAPAVQSSVSQPHTRNAHKQLSFHSEIAGMMYAFGDCRKPSPESVLLVEDIVHKQMMSLLVQAAEVTNMRGGRFTSIDDILFLMKGNKNKLRGVIRYLRLKDVKSKTLNQASPDEASVLDSIVAESGKGDSGKRLKLAFDFISSIDGTGELVALFDEDEVIDEIRQERLQRAERVSRSLESQAYLEYAEARRMSFSNKIGKFKEWLGLGSIDVKPSTAVIEIMSYLAYETISEIIDLALLVKEDQERVDVLSSVVPPSINPMSEIAKMSTKKVPTIPSGDLPTPTCTPPVTPTSSSGQSTASGTTTLTAPMQGGLASSLGTASLASSFSGLSKMPKAKKKRSKHGLGLSNEINSARIKPAHIREALRRYTMPVSLMAPYSASSRPTLAHRTLCF